MLLAEYAKKGVRIEVGVGPPGLASREEVSKSLRNALVLHDSAIVEDEGRDLVLAPLPDRELDPLHQVDVRTIELLRVLAEEIDLRLREDDAREGDELLEAHLLEQLAGERELIETSPADSLLYS